MTARRLAALAAAMTLTIAAAPAGAKTIELREFTLSAAQTEQLRERWVERILRTHRAGTWARMKMRLTNADLKLMGLPSRKQIRSADLSKPTAFYPDGRTRQVNPALISFAGAGYFGIRPGSWLLLLSDGIGWCTTSHVYGAPGSYSISTAGHCGKVGHSATAIGVIGNNTPVLFNYGTFKSSRDNGIGDDFARIAINSAYQHLVTPTMAFWGGPRGVFTKTGSTVYAGNFRPSINTDPFLAQQIAHYGHGTGIGAGGNPRSGTAIHWGTKHYSFFGAIAPGDSGSGANTVTGDTLGASMEAAGNITHLYVDPSLRTGLGAMAGTRTTVIGTPANGQLVGYPAPVPILP